MQKLFYEDQYLKNNIANITDIKLVKNEYHVKLDSTIFFFGGGGQFCDKGLINNCNVTKVYETAGEIIHVLDEEHTEINNVYCEIDWKRRKYGMTHHLGQHILSGCFFSLFNKNTCAFHMGNVSCTVYIVGESSK